MFVFANTNQRIANASPLAALALLVCLIAVGLLLPGAASAATHCVKPGKRLALPGGGQLLVPKKSVKGKKAKICAKRTRRSANDSSLKGTTRTPAVSLSVKNGRLRGKAKITLPFSKNRLNTLGLPLSDVVSIAFFNPASQTWSPVPTKVNVKRKTLTATISHFSWWDDVVMKVSELSLDIHQTIGGWLGTRADAAKCTSDNDLPSWAHTVTDNGPEIPIRTCSEGDQQGDAVVQIVNNRQYGMVLQYGGPVSFGWHESPSGAGAGIAAAIVDEYMGPNELYLPPLSKASVGVPRSAEGFHLFKAEVTPESTVGDMFALAFDGVGGIPGASDVATKLIAGKVVAKCNGFVKPKVDGSSASITADTYINYIGKVGDCATAALDDLRNNKVLEKIDFGKLDSKLKLLSKVGKYVSLAQVTDQFATYLRDVNFNLSNGGTFSVRVDPLPRERAEITWDTATDVDLHVWNQYGDHVYYADLEDIEGTYLVEDIIPGYGPEKFFENYWVDDDYTFGLCLFNGDEANVNVKIFDPGGGQRNFGIHLSGEKSASLVADSPIGEGYLPSPGWCDDEGYSYDPTDIGETS